MMAISIPLKLDEVMGEGEVKIWKRDFLLTPPFTPISLSPLFFLLALTHPFRPALLS